MIFRDTNPECFSCGAQYPTNVDEKHDGPIWFYECPECFNRLFYGIVQERGTPELAHITPPEWIPERAVETPTDKWVTWELWWTDEGVFASLMNGRVLYGNTEFADYVRKIYDIANDSL